MVCRGMMECLDSILTRDLPLDGALLIEAPAPGVAASECSCHDATQTPFSSTRCMQMNYGRVPEKSKLRVVR